MPSPNPSEPKENFLARCISSAEANKTFPDQQQRIAFCYSQWRNKDKKKSEEEKKNELRN